MKMFASFFIGMTILLVGCAQFKLALHENSQPPEESETTEQSVEYRTLLSPNNKPSIVRKPKEANYSISNPGNMTELPNYNPNSDEIWQVDLRSRDLTELDLNKSYDELIYADFDSKTLWPDELPNGFDPHMIMELGKNPGLQIRELHKKGVTGKGIGIAIIDQALLVEHEEYSKQLKMYEEIHCNDEMASMHGAAVASIAVGNSIGVAPEADLYYIAETHGTVNNDEFVWDLSWIAKSIDRIIEINKTLPKKRKIKVISISLAIIENKFGEGDEKVLESIEKAKQDGIYTIYVGSDNYLGLGRDPLKNADINTSFSKGDYWKKFEYQGDLLIPMDSRCTASPTGNKDYVFYRFGGMSWTVPYVAGLYALSSQVYPDITPDIFWEEAFKTCDTVLIYDNGPIESLKIVNPVNLIENLKKY